MARRALTGREAGIPRRSAGGSILVMHGRKASPRIWRNQVLYSMGGERGLCLGGGFFGMSSRSGKGRRLPRRTLRCTKETRSSCARRTAEGGCPHIWLLLRRDAVSWYFQFPFEDSMIRSYKGVKPAIPATCFVDESAQIIGDVGLGEHASVWMHAVVRGEGH